MNEERKKFYNPEKEITEFYKKIRKVEKVKVKDIDDLLVVHYYWKDLDGELWTNFDDPMENVRRDFTAYRFRVGFMQPSELKELRKALGMTVRDFGKNTGLGYGDITKIENNQKVQTKYQDKIFQLLRDMYDITGNVPINETQSASHMLNEQVDKDDEFNPNLFLDSDKTCPASTYSYDYYLGDAA